MNTLEAIYSRRSVRKYKPDPISEEVLNKILKAGMHAPTAGNQRPWHFVILTNHEVINKIPVIHPYSEMVRTAPTVVVVCCDKKLEKHIGYWDQDCSAATLAVCLAAHELKLGSCWLGVHPREDRVTGMREILNLPNDVIPFSIISLGYPNEEPVVLDRFIPDRIHYEKW